MVHGPCAGVQPDGRCEVESLPLCTFLDVPSGNWPYLTTRVTCRTPATELFAIAATRPLVVADFVAPPLSSDGLRRTAAELAPVADACLVGDSGSARVQFPPAYRAALLAGEGVRPWVGLNCRDRNRVAIEGEIAACVDAGAVALHCVTGDHPVAGHRPDAAPVFDLDCIGIVERAAPTGLLCSVAHAPVVPPAEHRLTRLLAKIDAGAEAVFIDHSGGVEPVVDAVAELRATGFRGLVLACVTNPAETGLAEAARLAEAMLGVPGVDGVNLSGGARQKDEQATATAIVELARRLRP
jgi:methylenetetrahydrofolate reductase (NADPH)